MIAASNAAVAATDRFKESGAQQIRLVLLLGAQQAIRYLCLRPPGSLWPPILAR
jgi:uracil phosphoribosyltransferase